MVSKSPNWGSSPYKWPKLLINGGDPNYLLTGMILQARDSIKPFPVELVFPQARWNLWKSFGKPKHGNLEMIALLEEN